MASEDLKQRFVQEIKLRAFDDKFVDRGEEKEILQIAIKEGVPFESARAALKQVCDVEHFALESAVMDKVKDLIDTFASNDGKVDEKEFNDAVSICKKACLGAKNDDQCKRMVLSVIDEAGSKVKTGMFSNWYARVKREVGMA